MLENLTGKQSGSAALCAAIAFSTLAFPTNEAVAEPFFKQRSQSSSGKQNQQKARPTLGERYNLPKNNPDRDITYRPFTSRTKYVGITQSGGRCSQSRHTAMVEVEDLSGLQNFVLATEALANISTTYAGLNPIRINNSSSSSSVSGASASVRVRNGGGNPGGGNPFPPARSR